MIWPKIIMIDCIALVNAADFRVIPIALKNDYAM